MRLLVLTTLFIFLGNQLFAQSLEGKANRNANQPHSISSIIAARSQGTSGTGSNIDVIYHKIFWRLNPDTSIGKYIKGSVQFNFKTTQASVSTITFDLRSVLLVDSIRFRNNQFTLGAGYTRTGNVVTLNLGTLLPLNFIDSFIVYYKGVPPNVVNTAQGFQLTTPTSIVTPTTTTVGNVLSTLSESYEDRDWWPCKHDMQDKIDSFDITVSVPWGNVANIVFPLAVDTFWVSTNGKMIDSAIVGNSRIFKFHSNYPIASYLVSVIVARFERTYWSVNTGSTNVQVVYNLLKGGTGNAAARTAITSKVNPTFQKWSSLFGEYPFKNDKHGFSDGMANTSAMEHQTMSSMPTSVIANVPTLIHEMTHQWFGDNVTFAHWNDLWLAEGFAEYSNPLSQEMVPNVGTASSAAATRNTIKNSTTVGNLGAIALSSESTWIPNANSTTSDLIWNTNYGSTIYKRGAMVVSMLRTMCGDSIFFATLTKYQTELAGKSVTTDTLRNYFNRALGRDISVFFDDYVGGSDTSSVIKGGIGSPTNTVNWNNPTIYVPSGKRLIISMGTQTKTAGSNVTYFRGPVQIHVKGALAANDTTITIFDWGGGNLSYAGKGISIPVAGNKLTFDLSFVPTTVLYDDSSRIMSRGLGATPFTGTTKLTTLEGYVWLGTTNTVWGTTTNWAGGLVPPIGGDVTIATTALNNPLLPTGNTTVGPLSILAGKILYLNNNSLTINNSVRYTGLISGSPTSNIIVADQAATLNFDQTSSATRSLFTLTLNPKASATIGTGLLEIYGGLSLPTSTSLDVKSANLLIR
jgi:Peptidase family M1 domain